jgi:hypothetical protein
VRGGASVWARTERVEARVQDIALRREEAVQDAELREAVARVAVETGVDPTDLLAEAQALVARARAAGARTQAEVDAFAATEVGLTAQQMGPEVARLPGGSG